MTDQRFIASGMRFGLVRILQPSGTQVLSYPGTPALWYSGTPVQACGDPEAITSSSKSSRPYVGSYQELSCSFHRRPRNVHHCLLWVQSPFHLQFSVT